jgi:hypothetical protein
LRQQILHNLMLVERKAGNGAAASRYEAEKKKAKAARRTPEGSDCGSEVEASDLKPEVASSFAEALRVIAAKHAEEEHSAPDQVTYAKPGEEGHDKLLKQQAALDTHPDGATVVWTSGPNASRNHAVIAKAGKPEPFVRNPVALRLRRARRGGDRGWRRTTLAHRSHYAIERARLSVQQLRRPCRR